MTDFDRLFSRGARAMQPSPIRRMAGLINQPGVISFAGGVPNPATFPDADLKRIMDDIVETDGYQIFQYGVTRGLEAFRQQLVTMLAGRGIRAADDGLMVTSGSQQGLELLSRVLLDPGDVVLVELPSYIGALACFRNTLAEMVGVAQDADGIVPEELERTIAALRGAGRTIKLLYVIPNFQNPSGITITPARRAAVLELARAHGILVVEDDPYGELYFPGVTPESLRAMRALPGGEEVVYLSSFSKVVSPGLRTAFMAAPPPVIRMLELAKQAADLCSSSLDQRLVYEYCKRGLYDRHLAEVRRFYAAKCEVMLAALDRHMPAEIAWTRPRGGMFVWLTLPAGLDAEPLAVEAVQTLKVAFIHGAPFFVNGAGRNTLRLTFAKEDAAKIEEGICLLAGFFKSKL
ncbi:MAG TPA: PLP-dependent aminotransferase family protein [Acidobacteriota bacterium]|nr:PLP-dependent aminotransferase family protein [Acidobacteriota bacterium]HOS99485.1 PLP-dependent aminotransferase family protein [Acidobacteriota bacterium]HQF87933.1 PLP-dependent aminotransferase family protein [Acidobacteriota bacterium]HQG92257.1 PLP-dependent aminotransferase family protein [Acidobacteriota bacterium]HQK87811.1 PLP-dependent aminotransferase family protein [Acidobacteriota bacterium]